MAIEFMDPGCEYYFSLAISNTPGIWAGSNAALPTNSAPSGRATTYALQMGASASQPFAQRNLSSNFATITIQGAYYIPSTIQNNAVLMVWIDGASTQVDLRVDSSGHLFFTRNGTTLGTSTLSLNPSQGWAYIEAEVLVDPSAGTAKCWVNGVSYLSLTGQNTRATANSSANAIRYGSVTNASGSAASYWKDMAVISGTGGTTSRIGDITVGCYFANGAGANQQFTASSGTQTSCVQDGTTHSGTWPDGDTSYISDATSGHISDFTHQAASFTGSILAAAHVQYVRKDDAGGRSFNPILISGATTNTATAIALGNSYNFYMTVYETDPNTGSAWTLTNFNNATIGAKVT